MRSKEEGHALRALKDGRYEEAYRICAGLRRESFAGPGALFLGAAALMGLGHIHEAQEWMAALGKAGGDELPRLYLEAFFQLHARRVDQALLLWTRIIHLFPADTFADGLIERARHDEERLLMDIEKPGALLRFVPLGDTLPSSESRRFRIPMPGKRTTAAAVFLVLAAGIGMAAWKIIDSRNPLSGLDETLPEPPSTGSVILDKEYKDAKYLYKNKDEVVRDYKEARLRITKGEVNKGRMILARIELSNASFELKERAKLLRDAVPIVPRRIFSDNVTLRQVLEKDDLYQGAQVLWRGTAGASAGAGDKAQYFVREPSEPGVQILVRCECRPPKEGDSVEIFGQIDRIRKKKNEIVINSAD